MTTEEQKILQITVKYDDAVKGIVKYRQGIEDLEAAEKKLKQDFKDGKVTSTEYARQMVANKEAVKQYKDNIRVLSKEIQNNLKREKEQEGSLKSLRAQLSNATKAYDEMSRAERQGAKGKELQKHINEITTELKAAEEETQRFYRNVGNYKQSILDAVAGNNRFAKSLLSIGGGGGAGAAMGAAGLAAAGVGALVAGIYTMKGVMSSAVDLIVDFEKANSNLAAVLGTTSDKIQPLIDDALRLGEATRYTSVEVTRLQTELAKLGFTQKEILDSTESILMFANATGAELGDAAQVAGAALRAFGDDAKNMGRYVSAMAVGTTKSALSFGDLSTSISTLAPVAHAFGFEIEDVVTLVGKLKDAGFDASSAATAARNILLNLADSNGKLAKSMGGAVKDMDGLQKGLQKLRDGGIDLATALELTDKRSVAAFEAFMTNAEGLTEMRKAVTGCEDGLKQMDETMQNNVQGSLAKLESAWQGLLLKFYSSRGVIKGVVDKLTEFVSWCSKLSNRFTDLYEKSYVVRAAWEAVVLPIKGTFLVLKNVVKSLVELIKGAGKALEGLVTLDFSMMWDGIKTVALAAPKMLYEQGKDAGQAFVDGFKRIVGKKKVKTEMEVEVESPDTGVAVTSGTDDGKKKFNMPTDSKGADKAAKIREQQAKKELEEVQKAERLMLEIVSQGAAERRKVIENEYNQQIATIESRLKNERNLTETAQQAMTSQMESLRKIRDRKMAEFDTKAIGEQIQREQKAIEMILGTVRKGTEEEYQLRTQKIENERQLALNAASLEVMGEEEKQRQIWAINQKYDQMQAELDDERTRAEVSAIEKRMQEKLIRQQMENSTELEMLATQIQAKKDMMAEMRQYENESDEAYLLRRATLEKEITDLTKKESDARKTIKETEMKAISQVMGGVSDVLEAFGEENEGLAKAAKFLSLAQIAINTGVAISEGTKAAAGVPYPGNLVAIASTIATVLANVATAIKTVKSAKFAEGGDVVGEGTGTSDSVAARLSNGESVLTAKATRMFAPALSAFNQIGGGVPITGGGSGGDAGMDFIANAVTKGMAEAPSPVVAVEEIKRVSNRIDHINEVRVIE